MLCDGGNYAFKKIVYYAVSEMVVAEVKGLRRCKKDKFLWSLGDGVESPLIKAFIWRRGVVDENNESCCLSGVAFCCWQLDSAKLSAVGSVYAYSCPLSDVDKRPGRRSLVVLFRRTMGGVDESVGDASEYVGEVNGGRSSGAPGALRARRRIVPDHHLSSPELRLAFNCGRGSFGEDGKDCSPDTDDAGDDERD